MRAVQADRAQVSPLLRYGAAVLFVAVTFLIYPLFGLAPEQISFALFVAAVALSAWYGGLGPGLLAMALCVLLSALFLIPPFLTLQVSEPSFRVRMVLFVITALIINGLSYARSLAEERTRQERTRLQVTLASIGDAVIATGTDGRVSFMNAVAETLTGWTQAEATGKDLQQVFKIVNEETRQPVENPAVRALSEGRIFGLSNHTVLIAKDGTERPLEDSAAPIRSTGGDIIGAVLVFRDITERRKAERENTRLFAQVEQEQQRFKEILSSVPGVVWEAWGKPDQTAQRIDFVSDYAESMLGYSVHEWLSTPNFWLTIVHPDDKEEAARVATDTFRNGAGTNRFRWVARDGHPIWVEAHSTTIRDSDGTPLGMRGVTMDITERKNLEDQVKRQAEELKTEYERLASLVANVDIGLAMLDKEGRYLLVNEAWKAQTGYGSEEVIGRRYEEFSTNQRASDFAVMIDRVVKGGDPLVLNNVFFRNEQRPDGWYGDFSVLPVQSPDGSPSGALIVVMDISEKARSQKQIEEQRAILETIVEGTPIGLALIGSDLKVISVNAEWARMTGAKMDDIKDRVLYEIHPSFRSRQEVYERVLAGEYVHLTNVPYSADGEEIERYRDIYLRPVYGINGIVTGMLNAVVDVTDRHLLDKQKDEFLAIASHELKTPITTIKGYTQLSLKAVQKMGNEKLIRALTAVDSKTNSLIQLINELLDVSRIQSGNLPLEVQEFDLVQLVREAVVSTELTSADFTIRTELPVVPVPVSGDRQRIEQVIANLLQNAVKYSRDQKEIEVRMDLQGNEVITSVRDYGVGIPKDQLGNVFNRFFRATNVSTTNYSGLGLGLFISHSIIERHGGRMWVESEEDQGSTFHFALPLSDQ